MVFERFQKRVLEEGQLHYRDMPWRNTQDPYRILLSEVMLQQTQVDRVIGYYENFIKTFPTIRDLAGASFVEVLSQWSGLGYNRRAKWLHEAAQKMIKNDDGLIPNNVESLSALPGIGHNTAAAVCAYAFNKPEVFIETNIRTVYIYHFFSHYAEPVADHEIEDLLKVTIYKENPRRWYWSLMDYGVFLKKTLGNFSQKSTLYRKKSKFEGSTRQVRGKVLKIFFNTPRLSCADVIESLHTSSRMSPIDKEKVENVLAQLQKEGFLVKDAAGYYSFIS